VSASRAAISALAETVMAGLVVFLGLIFFMFQAGYQWRKWEEETRIERSRLNGANLWDSMIFKL
jgi:hypothetical protein